MSRTLSPFRPACPDPVRRPGLRRSCVCTARRGAGAPVEPALLKVVRCGIATIGTQYFAGLREAEVREMLKAAEEELPCPPAGAGRDASDRVPEEGHPLYENASALERRLVTTAAQRPIKRITSV